MNYFLASVGRHVGGACLGKVIGELRPTSAQAGGACGGLNLLIDRDIVVGLVDLMNIHFG